MAAFLPIAAAVSAAAFLSIAFLLRAAELRRIDRDLDFFVHERAAEYLIGGEYAGPKHAITAAQLPARALAEFKARHPEARIAEAFSDGKRSFWFCAAMPDGSAVVAECGPNPASFSSEIRPASNRVGAMAAAFAQEYHGEGYGDIFHLLLGPGGREVVAHSPMPEEILSRMVATGRAENDIRGLAHLRFGGETWAADTEPLFDGSVYVVFHRVDRSATRAILATGAAALTLLLLAGTVAAWRLAGSVTRGLDRVVEATRRARNGDYAARIAHRHGEGAEIDQLVDAVNEMLERTQGAINDLRELSDDMAHDLKTPLTRLLARAELAFYEKTSALPASDVAEDCRTMLDLVNALLDLSRAANGPRPAAGESADLADVARCSGVLFSSLAEDKRIALAVDIPERPVLVHARLVHLQRITANLLDNAIKFTPEGGRVSIAVLNDERQASLVVSDTGCGISEADMPKLFKRFWRSDASRAVQGNGLGLALVQAFATCCGGSVAVDSTPGKGATFTVRLPLAS